VTYSVGDHTLTLVSGTTQKDKAITVSYSVRDALRYRDATGYQTDAKLVFDAAFTAVDQIITDGMSDAEKALAIHDYLIYHANYVNDGDYTTAENWAFGAEGVLLHGEGVCQSYAFAFYMMATAVGLKCDYITSATHAWNSVYIDGVRYYVDCTWDDPIGPTGAGGYENHDYFLSPTLWTDEEHVIESVTDLAEDGKYYWEYYYLTGEGYYLPWKTTSRTENQILVPTQSSAADVTIRVCPTRISW
jgi:transglutaminase/protease-like cytokinesis protein 3